MNIDFNAINQAVNHYLRDRSTTTLNTAILLIKEYIEAEAKKFATRNTLPVEVDDLVQEAWIHVFTHLTEAYVPDKKKPFTALMSRMVKQKFGSVVKDELHQKRKISRLRQSLDNGSSSKGKKL